MAKNPAPSDFEVGNTVVMITGGPVMAVNKVFDDVHYAHPGKVECQWFAGKKLEKGTFDPATLRHTNDDDVKKK